MTLTVNQISFGAKPTNKSFDVFSQQVIKRVRRGQDVKINDFTKELTSFEDCFEANKNVLNKKSKQLAETLVASNKDNMASIVYSFLIKNNEGNIKLVEEFATSGLKIAKRMNNPVQIMARANDLREVYKIFPPKNEKFINVLYDEKHALNKIINNYDGLAKQNKGLKTKEEYQILLADVKYDIGLRHTDKNLAQQELIEAKKMYETLGLPDKAKLIK